MLDCLTVHGRCGAGSGAQPALGSERGSEGDHETRLGAGKEKGQTPRGRGRATCRATCRPCNCHSWYQEEWARQRLLTYRIVGAVLVVLLGNLQDREVIEDHMCAQVAHTPVQLCTPYAVVVAAAALQLGEEAALHVNEEDVDLGGAVDELLPAPKRKRSVVVRRHLTLAGRRHMNCFSAASLQPTPDCSRLSSCFSPL